MNIPFNKPHMTGKEIDYINEAHQGGKLSGDGPFTKKCNENIEKQTQSKKVLITHSCTAALEMTALLLDLQENDEVIMPSYTFVSTANAYVLRGAIPVFVDIRSDTLNIDETKIEEAITSKTKAICVVHYAGVSCEMDTILAIAKKHNLKVIEDAAQGFMSTYKGRALGSIADMACFSFHETKNIISGEGGALLINNPIYIQQAEIIREKGTDRTQFLRGAVDKYTWKDKGSSYLPGELTAAFLYAQLEQAENITQKRLDIWNIYHQSFTDIEKQGKIKRPFIPQDCTHNAHMYYLILKEKNRNEILDKLRAKGIHAISHYEPLHSSIAGKKYTRTCMPLTNTDTRANQIIRLPLFYSLSSQEQDYIINTVITLL